MTEFSINLLQLFTISSIINGIIFCFLLLRKPENKRANRFLSLFIFSLVYTVAITFVLEFKLYDSYHLLHVLPFTMTYWIGPSFYFYIKNLVEPTFKFRNIHLFHFSLIFLNYFHSAYHLIYGRTIQHPLFHNFTEAVGTYAIISVLIYLVLAYKNVITYQKSIVNQLSNTDNLNLNWVKTMIRISFFAFIFIMIFKLIDYKELIDFSIDSFQGSLFPYRDIIPFVIAISVYWLSYLGYKQSQTASSVKLIIDITKDKDYSKTTEQLLSVMEDEQLFLDPILSLNILSEKIQIPEKEISLTLNKHLNKNFYNFVNEYRVNEVKKRLLNPKYKHLKIISIAYDCGFNSKPTFNRIFKEYTGKSPNSYRVNP